MTGNLIQTIIDQAFYKPISDVNVKGKDYAIHVVGQIEIICNKCDAYLGHVSHRLSSTQLSYGGNFQSRGLED